MSDKTYAAIRAHTIGRAELRLLNRLNIFFDSDRIVFAVDETRRPVATPAPYRKASVNRGFLEDRQLYADQPRAGWLCGDYFLYALLQEVPDAASFWLIEPDVHLGLDAARTLFDAAARREDDLLAPRFGPSEPRAAGSRPGLWGDATPHHCQFSLVRVSRRAIEHLLQARQRLYAQLRGRRQLERLWPADESFVATTLGNDATLRCADLTGLPGGIDFSHFSRNRIVPLDFAESGPRDAIMHPVLAEDPLREKLKLMVRSAMTRSELHPILAQLGASSEAHLKASIEAAVTEAARTWAARVLDERPPAFASPAPAVPAVREEPADSEVGNQPPGVAFRVRARPAPPPAGATPCGADFDVVRDDVAPLQDMAFAPGLVDAASRSILLLETPRAVLDEPNFTQAQRRLARWARRLPIDDCPPGVPEDVTSALVFTLDPAGMALFGRIAAASGHTVLRECDVFGGLLPLQQADCDRAFPYVVQSLAGFCGVPYAQLALGFGGQALALAPHAARLFPHARRILILRDAEPWSRTLIEKSDWTSQQLVDMLMQAVDAVRACAAAGNRLAVLRYEDFRQTPEQAFQALHPGREPTREELKRLQMLALLDARHGALAARRAAGDAQHVEHRVRDFLDRWSARKATAGLAELGLEAWQ